MQNNLVSKLQNLHRLKELEYANFAVNNIRKIENLQRCESLAEAGMTVNFIDKMLPADRAHPRGQLQTLEMYLMGNPCADFSGYRVFVVGTLPQLQRLDGKEVTPMCASSSDAAATRSPRYLRVLRARVAARRRGSLPFDDARDLAPDEDDVAETAALPEDERPWCPARASPNSARPMADGHGQEPQHHDRFFGVESVQTRATQGRFPRSPGGPRARARCNEPGVDFRLEDSEDGAATRPPNRAGKYRVASHTFHVRLCNPRRARSS